jgi:hypothetical protein
MGVSPVEGGTEKTGETPVPLSWPLLRNFGVLSGVEVSAYRRMGVSPE